MADYLASLSDVIGALAETSQALDNIRLRVAELRPGEDRQLFLDELSRARIEGDLLDKKHKTLRNVADCLAKVEATRLLERAEATAREIEDRRGGLRNAEEFDQLELHLDKN